MELGSLDPGELFWFFVVVDNRPDGRAEEICNESRAHLPCRLYFAEERKRGISFARNRAISTALAYGADLIAFIDDDDRPRPDWLAHLVDRQRATGADLECSGSGSCPRLPVIPRSLRKIGLFKPLVLDRLNQWAFLFGWDRQRTHQP